MPIKPENKDLYPPNWSAIRAAILARAGHRCEGSPDFPECRAENYQHHPITGSRVVLTVAHLNHDPADCRPENLRAWCQMCHLNYDRKHRATERNKHLRLLPGIVSSTGTAGDSNANQ